MKEVAEEARGKEDIYKQLVMFAYFIEYSNISGQVIVMNARSFKVIHEGCIGHRVLRRYLPSCLTR